MPDRVPVRVVRDGGLDFIEVSTAQEAQVAALQRERAGYLVRGLAERAAQVDAELERLAPTATSPTKRTRGTKA